MNHWKFWKLRISADPKHFVASHFTNTSYLSVVPQLMWLTNKTLQMEEGSEGMEKGDMPMQLRELRRTRLITAFANKLTLSQHKGDERVVFVFIES